MVNMPEISATGRKGNVEYLHLFFAERSKIGFSGKIHANGIDISLRKR
jgi:hypothetical protein